MGKPQVCSASSGPEEDCSGTGHGWQSSSQQQARGTMSSEQTLFCLTSAPTHLAHQAPANTASCTLPPGSQSRPQVTCGPSPRPTHTSQEQQQAREEGTVIHSTTLPQCWQPQQLHPTTDTSMPDPAPPQDTQNAQSALGQHCPGVSIPIPLGP
ncbi:hypothetical protein CRENBAI_006946 [Crenichthys baileyi]|uniref:Uncharacterized protein n=1 Tax=Crenichthys baileyi TaxID=28760 RepID=A0AAV9R7E6_9TELE